MQKLQINPPLLNTPCPWASDLEMLQALYASPHLGAITTRTAMLNGFPHNPDVNQFVLFEPTSQQSSPPNQISQFPTQNASLNTIGFSPYTLNDYLGFIQTIAETNPDNLKTVIVSVTGTPEEVAEAYQRVNAFSARVSMPIAMEINLSCPNIPGKVSPAYDQTELLSYLSALKTQIDQLKQQGQDHAIAVGIKTPPFTYQEQFDTFIHALVQFSQQNDRLPFCYIASTNTLGSSLLMNHEDLPTAVLNSMTGTGIGGMAGSAIHPLSLGNVYTLRQMLNQHEALKSIQILGVGGVSDIHGYRRMKAVGADFVGIATAIGVKGIAVFEEIHLQM
ncbi:dihydroorotate dehydrogenase [Haemophilus paracuniculus]|uniref:dihydroorotate oxidase (fumarate) n=1 Tax=Haemophilus paracuniculus TaxID=734 RepID=A0A1T0AUU8_9PAST|nr:dihydroorotate dehydrogenase [Haemophilus paracuniculus]OOS00241.1 dihydroorotate dehydrogenase [Haemophilus paracuniculus]